MIALVAFDSPAKAAFPGLFCRRSCHFRRLGWTQHPVALTGFLFSHTAFTTFTQHVFVFADFPNSSFSPSRAVDFMCDDGAFVLGLSCLFDGRVLPPFNAGGE